jgi:hypothetical protein
MKHLREQLLFALSAGDVDELAEMLGEIHTISQQSPNQENDLAPLQKLPGVFNPSRA